MPLAIEGEKVDPLRTMRPFVLVVPLALLLVACSSGDPTAPDDPKPAPTCAEGEELFRGACVDPAKRYEPSERVDLDNVVAFGEPLTELELPEPPKSGFRIVAPPRVLSPRPAVCVQ